MGKKLILSAVILLVAHTAQGQNNSGVTGPVVNEGYRSFEYRLAFEPDAINEDETGYAQRFNYKHSLNGDVMLRLVTQVKKTTESNNDFDYVQGEVFWQTYQSDSYASGVRFDLRYRDNDRANQIGVNWLNQIDFENNWQARILVAGTLQYGDNSKDGIGLSSAAYISKKLDIGRLGFEIFSSYGSTDKIKSFSDQNHSAGLFLSNKIGNSGWSYFVGALFGVTDASPDQTFRFRISKKL